MSLEHKIITFLIHLSLYLQMRLSAEELSGELETLKIGYVGELAKFRIRFCQAHLDGTKACFALIFVPSSIFFAGVVFRSLNVPPYKASHPPYFVVVTLFFCTASLASFRADSL